MRNSFSKLERMTKMIPEDQVTGRNHSRVTTFCFSALIYGHSRSQNSNPEHLGIWEFTQEGPMTIKKPFAAREGISSRTTMAWFFQYRLKKLIVVNPRSVQVTFLYVPSHTRKLAEKRSPSNGPLTLWKRRAARERPRSKISFIWRKREQKDTFSSFFKETHKWPIWAPKWLKSDFWAPKSPFWATFESLCRKSFRLFASDYDGYF